MTITTHHNPSQPITTYVINLARDAKRWKWFLENAMKASLKVERIDAIDAKNIALKNSIEEHKSGNCKLSDSEVACILSHRKAWQMLLDSTSQFCAIFEDDVLLSLDTGSLLTLDLLPESIDLIKLETLNRKVAVSHKLKLMLGNRQVLRLLTKHYCTAGYVLSRKAAKRLLELTEVNSVALDFLMFDESSPFWCDFEVHQLIPALCMQDQIYAEIHKTEGHFLSNIETTQRRFTGKGRNLHRLRRSYEKVKRYFELVINGAKVFRTRIRVPFK
jgi:glycosyl transferase, family 25